MIHAPWHLHTTRELTPHHIVVTSQRGSFRVCRTSKSARLFLGYAASSDWFTDWEKKGFTDLSYSLAKLIPARRSDSCGKAHPCSSWGHSFPQIETSGAWASVVSQDHCNREIIVKTHLSMTIQPPFSHHSITKPLDFWMIFGWYHVVSNFNQCGHDDQILYHHGHTKIRYLSIWTNQFTNSELIWNAIDYSWSQML
jgi:hypothetical protein